MIPIKLEDKTKDKHLNWIFGENSLNPKRLLGKLTERINNEEANHIKEFLIDIQSMIRNIIIGDLKELYNICEAFDEYIAIVKKRSSIEYKKRKGGGKLKVFTDVEKIYNHLFFIFVKEYDYFSDSKGWNAYLFQKDLEIEVCPYCATQNIFLYKNDLILKKGQTRGVLDHFFDKGTYPFLAVSLYNLVPCCKVCNSDMKGIKKFGLASHYSPYEIEVHNFMKFKIELVTKREELIAFNAIQGTQTCEKSIDYFGIFTGDNQDFNLKIDYKAAPDSIRSKIKGNLEVFNLERLYNLYHKKNIQNKLKKLYVYDQAYRNSLKDSFNVFWNSEIDFENDLYDSESLDNKKILNKLSRDILKSERKYLEKF